MTDPLSSAGGALAVVSLGITVCQGLVKYYGSWNDYVDDGTNLTINLQRLEATFVLLEATLKERFAKSPIQTEVEIGFSACRLGLEKLKQRLFKVAACTAEEGFRAKMKSTRRRALYPFKANTLAKLHKTCLELRDNLSLPLQLLQLCVPSWLHILRVLLFDRWFSLGTLRVTSLSTLAK